MTNTSKPIIFFGTEDFSLTILQGLVSHNYDIKAVVTKPDSKSGRGQKLTQSPVKIFAIQTNIPVWQPLKLVDIADDIRSIGVVAGVLASYGEIIPSSILELFSPGIINVHPSLLPIYRGPSPIESAIANGDDRTGVTIMKLAPAMDSGPIYAQIIHKLMGTETRIDLYKTLASAGNATLLATLPDILAETLQPLAQDDSAATYCSLLDKKDSWLQIATVSALEAERLVRAHLGFPKTKLRLLDHDIVITKAHISTEQKTPLDILCRDGAYLSIDELIAPSGRTMSSNAFLNGYAAA